MLEAIQGWSQWRWLAVYMGFWTCLMVMIAGAQLMSQRALLRGQLNRAGVPTTELLVNWSRVLGRLWSLLFFEFVVFLAFRTAVFVMDHVMSGGCFYWGGVCILGFLLGGLAYKVLDPPMARAYPQDRVVKEITSVLLGIALMFLFDQVRSAPLTSP